MPRRIPLSELIPVDPQAAAAASGEEDITEVATTRAAIRAAVRLAGSWKDDLRDVRCKM